MYVCVYMCVCVCLCVCVCVCVWLWGSWRISGYGSGKKKLVRGKPSLKDGMQYFQVRKIKDFRTARPKL